ncbi:raftlin-like [Scleropages formosus]|uniref:Raftlin-like n=2 Tax=Scleropages formosus TaxID=113540 RepID=A0A0P7XF10_SCLFO|nr:raftlin-like [Scleropages formosus]
MGCRLPKLKRSDENSPGKIYSTLKRPQVETKVGVAYTYRFLDFILGRDDGTSMLCISSVRELPGQMLELYQQGFVLAAVHPFIHPCSSEPASAQRLLYRAVLIRHSDKFLSVNQSGLNSTGKEWKPLRFVALSVSNEDRAAVLSFTFYSVERPEAKSDNRLEMEMCLSADQVPSVELIQGYLKRIQDAAEQGIAFVGFVQQPSRALNVLGQEDPDEISLSLHSSPSSVQGSKAEQNQDPEQQSPLEEQDLQTEIETKTRDSEFEEVVLNDTEAQTGNTGSTGDRAEELSKGLELFALFNHPGTGQGLLKYYTVKVPLRVQVRDEEVVMVEASWLDHMTQHFNSGSSLVDGYFHLGSKNGLLLNLGLFFADLPPKSVESVFIFQEGPEGESGAATAYDAIVVEQWTVIDGAAVKTDYIPLLQSLAMYGWRLTCVLPTPLVKTNSDGSLATKQIVFLQRPILPRKKKESKILNFKTRNKSNKNSVKDVPKEKMKKNESPGLEKETDEQKTYEGGENEEVARKNNDNQESERLSLEKGNKGKGEQGPEAVGEVGEAGSSAEDGEERGGREPGDEHESGAGQESRSKAQTEKGAEVGEEVVRGQVKDGLTEVDDAKNSAARIGDGMEDKVGDPNEQKGGREDGRGSVACEDSVARQSELSREDSEVVVLVSVESESIPEAVDSSSVSAALGTEGSE